PQEATYQLHVSVENHEHGQCEPNRPPVATDDAAATNPGMPVVINVLANDTDPDADPLIVTAIVVPPPTGAAIVNGDGSVTFEPGNTPPCTEVTFTYAISDGNGGTD